MDGWKSRCWCYTQTCPPPSHEPVPQKDSEGASVMKNNELIKRSSKLANHYRVTNGEKFRLKEGDPGDTLDFKSEDKDRAKEALASGVELLAELQDKLYAQDRWGVLLIFQAMDAAGKDGAIKHVM